MFQNYSDTIEQLMKEDNLRKLPDPVSEDFINLSSNDYLGINSDSSLRNEFIQHISHKSLRLSAVSSRLLTGNSEEYISLETTIAHAYKKEACLVYNSGYHANIGILPSLAGKNDLIISDKLVHASIIDGIKLSSASHERFNHLNYNHLETILKKNRNHYQQIFIVTESIFSMDGDIADLLQLIELKKKYSCFLYVDEAHAFGVRGQNGLGCAEEYNCIDQIDFIVGTFGKAIASIGAYLVCDNIIKQYLINRSRSFIFTTALPPFNLAWTGFIFDRLSSFQKKRKHLHELSKSFAGLLGQKSESQIIPFIIGNNKSAIDLSLKLRKEGIFVLPIRYPTVPKDTARLRFSLNANLTLEDLNKIPEILKCNATIVD